MQDSAYGWKRVLKKKSIITFSKPGSCALFIYQTQNVKCSGFSLYALAGPDALFPAAIFAIASTRAEPCK